MSNIVPRPHSAWKKGLVTVSWCYPNATNHVTNVNQRISLVCTKSRLLKESCNSHQTLFPRRGVGSGDETSYRYACTQSLESNMTSCLVHVTMPSDKSSKFLLTTKEGHAFCYFYFYDIFCLYACFSADIFTLSLQRSLLGLSQLFYLSVELESLL